jgi:hypothetical protein
MTREVKGVQARMLALLVERWPVTLGQVALALHLRPDAVELDARRLAARGLVVLEPLGMDVYVALTGEGVKLLGLPPKEAERLRDRKPTPPRPRDEHDPAFG